MSKCKNEVITCPKCGARDSIVIYDSINVGLDSELKERILNRKMFSHKCTKCSGNIDVFFSTLYHDPDKKLMIYYLANNEDESIITENVNTSMLNGYTLRVVKDLNHLIEKIMVAEDNLDDMVVDALKPIVLGNAREQKLEGITNIFYDYKENDSIYFALITKDNVVSAEMSMEAYDRINKSKTLNYPTTFAEINEYTISHYLNKNS